MIELIKLIGLIEFIARSSQSNRLQSFNPNQLFNQSAIQLVFPVVTSYLGMIIVVVIFSIN